MSAATPPPGCHEVRLGGDLALGAFLGIPEHAAGIVIFAHGSGSGRTSPRNNYVAQRLREAGLATLLLDLLSPAEEHDRRNVFDIGLLASRLRLAVDWVRNHPPTAQLKPAYFGASTGGGAAIRAANGDPRIAAIVSRGGRPDLAGIDALAGIKAPTLLIVGSLDGEVIELNRTAAEAMHCEKQLAIVAGAGHLFEEPGTLDQVVDLASAWFLSHLGTRRAMSGGPFTDRREAGRLLARAVSSLRLDSPVVLALPRGGVPVGYEVAKQLKAPFDILLVRKIGAPGHEEFGIGALVDGASPQIVIDEATARMVGADRAYIEREVARQLVEIERRRAAYGGAPPIPLEGRTVVVVDDGIATGGTVKAALRALQKVGASKIVLAVPVAPRSSLSELRSSCDEIICLSTPEPFYAVGAHYVDFDPTSDEEVVDLLARSSSWA